MLRKLFNRKSNDSAKRPKVQSCPTCAAATSTPNVSTVPLIACATSMPNISVIERSTSVPALVSDASIGDLYSQFKRCCTSKNETFQINTMRFLGHPKGSPGSRSPREFPRRCPKNEPRTSPSKDALNNSLHKDTVRICLPKKSPRICYPKESPKTCPPMERTGSRSSLNNFLRKDSPRTSGPKDPVKIYLPKEGPRNQDSPRLCLKSKKTRFKCECGKSSELLSSDEAMATADNSECVEELYFNDEAKKSGGSTPRGHSSKERSTDFLKIIPSSEEELKKIKKDAKRRPCDRVPKDSGATSSLVDSTSATCDASATYYHNKLLATLQILQNKEETISVQADSLAVAEERIAKLNERANELKKELDRKTKEYSSLRKSVECCKPVQTVDVCLITDRPMEDQTDIVNTLENNLCVIEDLYRECFYETAKQENLIEMLRSSYLDVRLMDRQKADQIGRLQTVINTQQWSLDRCQDIALEVDGLKMEISNFLNSSSSTNNDSGMWERSEESYAPAPGVQDELHDVREQLLRLQDLLALDSCTCGLFQENMKLKKRTESQEIKVGELREKICELESTLSSKWEADSKCKVEIELKGQELARIREQLVRSQNCSREQSSTVESISIQLGQTKALLCEKTAEVSGLRQEIETQANKIKELQEELAKADHIIKENCKMRSEVAYLTTQVQLWRAQLGDSERRVRALEADLARTRAHAAHIDTCYREKAGNVAELQAHLEQAHARGAALCGEARRAVGAVRVWMRRMRDKHREKDIILKEKNSLIAVLRRRLEERRNDSQCTSTSENTASCSKCQSSREERNCCSKSGLRRGQCHGPSVSEMPSCSSTPAPMPMRLRKKQGANNHVWMCDAALQQPTRQDAGSDASDTYCRHRDVRHVRLPLERPPRDLSPTDDLLLRVEQLTEALADSNRRWTQPRDER